jgi:hypothetical protein
MRFNNRFCALMDIPDLPAGAFEHIGDKKIKPQGGGNPFSGVTDTISSALGTDGGGGGILGALADIDPGPAIGRGLADVDKFVGREIPGGWKTVGLAAAAAAAPYAIGAMGAGAGSTAGGFVAADAAGLAASGLSEAAIAQNLAMAGVESFVAADAAALAVSGLSEAAIAQNLAYAYGADLGGTALATAASSGAPITDYSTEAMVTPEGNVIPANTLPSEVAGMDAQIKSAGQEALKKYGGGMSTMQKTMLGANMARGLLGSAMPMQQNPYQQQVARQQMPGGAVDYSGLLALLSPRSAQRKTSLLG